MNIEYGVKITTGQTALTDYSIGLVGGVIQWVTGRPNLDGWKEGIISKGSFSPVEQAIEIARGGGYATMSGFSLKIRPDIDGVKTWKRIRDLGLNLIQADAVVYCWRDGVQSQDWTGKVADTEAAPDGFKLQFMDAFRAIHKPLAAPVGISEFPDAPKASIGKSIPIALGRISHAKLLNVRTSSGKIACSGVSGIEYKFCACDTYPVGGNYRVIKLKTGEKVFAAGALNDMVLTVIHGGASQSRRIVFNSASSGTYTQVSLDTKLDVSTPFVGWSTSNATDEVWYVEISDNGAAYALSQNPIHSFIKSSDSQNSFNDYVEIYKDETRRFSKILGIDFTKSTTDVSNIGYPGMNLKSKFVTSSGSSQIFTAIKPTSIALMEKTIHGSLTSYVDELGAISSNPSDLIDSLYSTGYNFTWSIADTSAWSGNVLEVTYQITIPQDALEEDINDIFLLPAFDAETSAPAPVFYVKMIVKGVDFYGRDPVPIASIFTLSSSLRNLIWLHENYFSVAPGYSTQFAAVGLDTEESPTLGIAKRKQFSLSSIISGAHKLGIYNKYEVTFHVEQTAAIGSATNSVIRFREVGLISAYDFNFADKSFYVKIIGETFGGTWGGRRTAADPILTIADAVEHVIRDYDGEPDAIDTTAFDALSDPSTGTRKDWMIGRQLTDNANAFDICRELARFGFFGIVPTTDGKRAPKAWLEYGETMATHNAASINAGSMGPREMTALSDVFNDLKINFAWNPGSENYDRYYHITRITEAAFPAESDPEWKTYAVGFTDAQYATAAAQWAKCHLSWQRYGLVQSLPDELANCPWFPDVVNDFGLTEANNSALLYLIEGASWWPFRKDLVPYDVPNTAANAALELLDSVTVNDVDATAGLDESGWIVRKAIVPGAGDDDKDYIKLTVMFAPVTT